MSLEKLKPLTPLQKLPNNEGTLVMSEMQKWFFLFLETSIFTDFLNGPTPASFSFILSLFNQTIQFYKKSM